MLDTAAHLFPDNITPYEHQSIHPCNPRPLTPHHIPLVSFNLAAPHLWLSDRAIAPSICMPETSARILCRQRPSPSDTMPSSPIPHTHPSRRCHGIRRGTLTHLHAGHPCVYSAHWRAVSLRQTPCLHLRFLPMPLPHLTTSPSAGGRERGRPLPRPPRPGCPMVLSKLPLASPTLLPTFPPTVLDPRHNTSTPHLLHQTSTHPPSALPRA